MKFIAKQKNILLLLILVGLFFAFLLVNASDNGEKKLQTAWPPTPIIGTSLTPDSTLPTLIKYIYEWGVSLGGLAVFIAMIIAGIQYLTSMGDPAQMKDAFDRIRSAFFGIVLLLSSLLILNTINPDLTSLQLGDPPKPEDYPEVEKHKLDIEEIKKASEKCDKIVVYWLTEKSEGEIVLKANECKSFPTGVTATQITHSQAFIGTEEKNVCRGNLQFYSSSGCTVEVGTLLPPTNNPLDLSEGTIKWVKFILQ